MAATLSLANFLSEFPEFREAEPATVQAKLDQAHRAYSPSVLGPVYLDAVRYKTADLLSSSPFGRSLRLDKGNGPSIYVEQLERVLAGVAASGSYVD